MYLYLTCPFQVQLVRAVQVHRVAKRLVPYNRFRWRWPRRSRRCSSYPPSIQSTDRHQRPTSHSRPSPSSPSSPKPAEKTRQQMSTKSTRKMCTDDTADGIGQTNKIHFKARILILYLCYRGDLFLCFLCSHKFSSIFPKSKKYKYISLLCPLVSVTLWRSRPTWELTRGSSQLLFNLVGTELPITLQYDSLSYSYYIQCIRECNVTSQSSHRYFTWPYFHNGY